jgi:hypothetical protein
LLLAGTGWPPGKAMIAAAESQESKSSSRSQEVRRSGNRRNRRSGGQKIRRSEDQEVRRSRGLRSSSRTEDARPATP